MQNNKEGIKQDNNANEQVSQNKLPDGRETNPTSHFERRTLRGKGIRWQNMFEPRPFSEKSSAQDNLIVALKNRNLVAFEQALADPDVDPDYWYGKPFWSTALQLAAQTEGCEPFVLALLRAGAGSPRANRGNAVKTPSTPTMPTATGGAMAGGVAQGAAVLTASVPGPEEAVDAASLEAAAGAAAGHRLSFLSSSPRSSWVQPMGQDADQQNIRYWLRDLGRAVRDMSQFVGGEIHTLSEHMEALEERVSALERAQQMTNENLRKLVHRHEDEHH